MEYFYLIILFGLKISISGAVEERCIKKIKVDMKTKIYECDDNSISFDQAKYSGQSSKKSNYNGLCGATAAANVFHSYCQNLFIEPTIIGDKYFSDYTPGIRPDTMETGLNRMFENNKECLKGQWKYYYTTTRYDFIQSLKIETKKSKSYLKRKISNTKTAHRSPVIVLISRNEGQILHYVTVLDVINYKSKFKFDGCRVIYNDFGDQSSASCSDFSNYANQVDNTLSTKILPEYVHLVFEQ